VNTFNDVAGED